MKDVFFNFADPVVSAQPSFPAQQAMSNMMEANAGASLLIMFASFLAVTAVVPLAVHAYMHLNKK